MADNDWKSLPDIDGDDSLPKAGMGLFQLLRRLETDGRLFGHSGGPQREPARLGQHVRMDFAKQDIARYAPATEDTPAQVDVVALGLLGPEAPLPLHVTRWVLDRLSQRWFSEGPEGATADTTFVDFCNMLQHRMLALYFRAWADTRPEVQIQRAQQGRIRCMLGSLGGIGLPGMEGVDPELDPIKLRQAQSLARQVQGPERLADFVADAVGVRVSVAEFIGYWQDIPNKLQSRLGHTYARLGKEAAIGPRSFQRSSRIELQLGPLSLSEFQEFLPEGSKVSILKKVILYVAGQEMIVDLRLVLKKQDIPATTLGNSQLSRTAWLAPKREIDATDVRIGAIVGRAHNMSHDNSLGQIA